MGIATFHNKGQETAQVRFAISIISGLTLIGTAFAQSPAGSPRDVSCWPDTPLAEFPEDFGAEDIELISGDADISADGSATFQGPIEMRSKSRSLKAGSAVYDKDNELVSAEGGVKYEDPVTKIEGDSVKYNTGTGEFLFSDAEFELREIPARGSANKLQIAEPGVLELQRVRITSCPAGRDDWLLRAKSLELDDNTGMGTARGASLSFKGVPFLYFPYFTYPITDDRKSGLLIPKFGSSDKRGFEYTQPIYWNISPGMDATFVPRYMADRGLQIGLEQRYLTQNNEGVLWGDYLSDDDETDEDRWQYEVKTETLLPWKIRGSLYGAGVSDDDYFEDMGNGVVDDSEVFLNREAALEYYDRVWSVYARVQDFQTIDAEIESDEDPYTQMPRIDANALWRNGILGMDYGFDSEVVYFTRDDSVKGVRTHVQPKISRRFGGRGLYLMPEVAFDYTAYNLDDQPDGETSSPDRAAPILSIDTGAVFEKRLNGGSGRLVTLEPRLLYTYVPERNQDDIPIFDTIRPDFNFVQLYRRNEFIGYDRLGDINKVSFGVTGRVLDSTTGRELFRAALGHTRFLKTGDVILPGETPSDSKKSNYIAELDVNRWQNLKASLRYEYDSDERNTERSSFSLRYKPAADRGLNLSYRYARDDLEQASFSFAWPISKSWNAIGRYTFSFFDKEQLDEFVGIEYSSCCWSIGVVADKSVVRSTGDRETSISVQFALKGLSGFGGESTTSIAWYPRRLVVAAAALHNAGARGGAITG